MRLIDADALYEILKEHWYSTEDYEEDSYDMGNAIGFNNGINHAEHHVLCAQTVDAVPVKHGQWDGYGVCSCCGLPWDYLMTQNAQDDGFFDPMPLYCPNCGAKMDVSE